MGDKNQLRQLYRYWHETPAKVGILTNGIEYRSMEIRTKTTRWTRPHF